MFPLERLSVVSTPARAVHCWSTAPGSPPSNRAIRASSAAPLGRGWPGRSSPCGRRTYPVRGISRTGLVGPGNPADSEFVEAAHITWRPLGRLLVEQGLLTGDELERALAE